MFKQAQKRVGTGTLNRVLREAVEAHPPADAREPEPADLLRHPGRHRPADDRPVRQQPSLFDATYQRYLLNVFREKLPFHDVPIKLYLRARTQSDPNAPASGRGSDGRLRPDAADRPEAAHAHVPERARRLPAHQPRGQRTPRRDRGLTRSRPVHATRKAGSAGRSPIKGEGRRGRPSPCAVVISEPLGSLGRPDVQLAELAGVDRPGAPVIRSVPLAVLGKAMQSRMLVRPA